ALLTRYLNVKQRKNAGKDGEQFAERLIKSVSKDGDIVLKNVELDYEGRKTELDFLIVNRNGVFIIEVKNYSGRIEGLENDNEWRKYHVSRGGNVYYKSVRNPVKQVKREVDILSRLLRSKGFKVWIEGYAFVFCDDMRVSSERIILNESQLERIIHTPGRKPPDNNTVNGIVDLFD
ncbi:MAG: NERD domain-containing protein, partial [Clostridia bacterium]|nr:NERD domain-containing protein [Clostridia bacterium]